MTFREIRLKGGYKTQDALAEKVGVKKASVGRWENGQRYPRPDKMVELAGLLNVTTDEIIAAITQAKRTA